MRLERRGSGVGIGAGQGDGSSRVGLEDIGSWAEAEDARL
jgi:hypothetical protein